MRKKIAPLLLTILLTGCGIVDNYHDSKDNDPQTPIVPSEDTPKEDDDSTTEDVFKGAPIINFDNSSEDNNLFWASNNYSNGQDMFLSTWKKENARVNDGMIEMTVNDKNNKNYGAEIRTKQGYLYGYFGAKMKTFKKSGTVQSIFTYNGGRYTWDEIDIEFLGKDTTKVQFNYYHEGVGGHEYLYDLGFDSSLDFHDYGFKWEENKITWYVDFKPVYQVTASLGQWGFFFINTWAATENMVNWTGSYTPDDENHTAYYDYMSYAPLENEKAD